MSPSIATAVRAIRGEWRPPTYHRPLPIELHQLEPLEPLSGKACYAFQDLELEQAGPLLDPDFDIIPNGWVLKVRKGDRLYYQGFTYHEKGWREQLKTAVAPAVKAPEPQKVIDLLTRFDLFTKQGVYWIRGVKPIRERLRRKGIEQRLSADRTKAVTTGAGGKAMWSHLDAAAAVEPLTVPDLRGETPYCEVTKHRTPAEAVTVAAGGLAWCGECQP